MREKGIDNKKASSIIPSAVCVYKSSDEEEESPPGFVIPMRLRDCYAYGKDGRDDAGWGGTYRVIQAMHKNIIGADCPDNLDYITERVPGKTASKEKMLEPLDA